MFTPPLVTLRDEARAEWVDYNGHLRDAFHLLLFSFATDGLLDRIGLDAAGRERLNASVYTLEAHINYFAEVKQGAALRVETQWIAHDAKRLQVYHALYADAAAEPASVSEQMLMNVDTRGPRSAPFAPEVRERIEALAAAHAALPRPAHAGRRIELPPPRSLP